MADDRIDSIIDTGKIQGEIDFLKKNLDEMKATILKFPAIKTKVDGANNLKELSKAQIQLAESHKAVDQLVKQRFASEAKLITLQTDYAKATAANRNEIQKTNKELKDQASYNAANTGSIEKARAAVALLNTERNKLNLYTKEGQTRQAELNEQINKYNDFIKKSVDGLSAQKINVGNYSGAVSFLKKELEGIVPKMEKLKAANTTITTSMANGVTNTASYTIALKQNEEELVKLQSEYELLNTLVNTQEAGFASATMEIRANQKALLDLENAGLAGTESFKELERATGGLQDQLGDLKARTKALGSDTFVFDGLIKAAEGLAGVYGAAQGAAALFGDSNEDLQKTFVKLQSVMAIIQSLQAVQNALQAESAAMLLLQDIRTKALAISQGIYAVAVGTSTGAMKLFRIALLATGIGAVIGLLYLAADAMGVFGSSTQSTTEDLEAQAEALEKNKKSLGDIATAAEKNRNAAQGGLNDLKRQLELATARGASEKELQKIKDDIYAKERLNLLTNFNTFKGYADEQNEINQQGLDLKNKYEADKLATEKKAIEDAAKLRGEMSEKEKKRLEQINADAKKLAEERATANFEVYRIEQQRKIDFYKEDADNETISHELRLNALQNYLVARLELIQKAQENEKRNATKEQGSVIDASAKDERIRLARDVNTELTSIQDQFDKDHQKKAIVINDSMLDIIKQNVAEQIAIDKKKGEDILANEQEMANKKKELYKQLYSEIQSAIFQFIDDGFKREEQDLDERKRLLDEDTQRRINNIDQLGLSEVERVKKTAQIEKEAAFQAEQIEKRKRAIAVERAKFEKAASIASIIASTAQAIVGALAQAKTLGYAALPLAVLIGAIGALQLAKAISTPLPKYKDGRGPGKREFAIGGDGGKNEFIKRHHGGIEMTPAVPTLIHLEPQDIVYKDINALSRAMIGASMNRPTARVNGNNSISNLELLHELKKNTQAVKGLKMGIYQKIDYRIETTPWYIKQIKY